MRRPGCPVGGSGARRGCRPADLENADGSRRKPTEEDTGRAGPQHRLTSVDGTLALTVTWDAETLARPPTGPLQDLLALLDRVWRPAAAPDTPRLGADELIRDFVTLLEATDSFFEMLPTTAWR